MSKLVTQLNMYLAGARSKLDGNAGCRIVIGNEAADLDSMASAVMYGFFAAACEPRERFVVVPVINIPRADFILRTEAVYLFGALGIDVAALLFIDEVDLSRLHREDRLRPILVDHNILAAHQAGFADAVTAIIDHHDDAGLYRQAKPRTIEPVGSAATLVAEAILRSQPKLVDEGTATLLLGTILIDTVNLNPDAGRVTAKDRDIAARLAATAGGDPDALFAKLQFEKFNVAVLGTGDLLRKDYKEWEAGSVRYGIGTVLTSLEDWIAKDPDIDYGCDNFRRSKGLDCLLAMMASTDSEGAFRRELAVVVPDEALRDRLLAFLEATSFGLRRFVPKGLAEARQAVFFSQSDSTVSRKKLQPLLQALFTARD